MIWELTAVLDKIYEKMCMYIIVYAYMYICIVCMYACIYVYTYVCMYVFMRNLSM